MVWSWTHRILWTGLGVAACASLVIRSGARGTDLGLFVFRRVWVHARSRSRTKWQGSRTWRSSRHRIEGSGSSRISPIPMLAETCDASWTVVRNERGRSGGEAQKKNKKISLHSKVLRSRSSDAAEVTAVPTVVTRWRITMETLKRQRVSEAGRMSRERIRCDEHSNDTICHDRSRVPMQNHRLDATQSVVSIDDNVHTKLVTLSGHVWKLAGPL